MKDRMRISIYNQDWPYKAVLKDKFATWGLIFVVVQGLNFAPSKSGWGLDPSWGWLTVRASQFDWFAKGSYIWTHGPTYFLDSQVLTWKVGYLLAAIFRLSVGVFFYHVTRKHFSKLFKNKFTSTSCAVVLTTVSFMMFPPSLILIAGLAFYLFANMKSDIQVSWKLAIALSGVTSIEILNKIFQGSLAIILSLALINLGQLRIKKSIFYLMLMMSSLVSFFYLAGFGKESLLLYFRGQYELTTGYKAMASEIPGGLWEYFAFVIISVFAAYNVIKMSGLRVPAIAFFIISVLTFQYGFVRHDSHSNTAFFFLLVICLAIFGQSNLRSSLTSISMPILVFLMVSQFSMGNLLDATARIQGFTNQLRLADPRYRTQFIQNDLTALQQNAKLNQNMQSLIGESAVAQIPSDQLVGKAFDLNLISPPIPQQYSAYTPWLDETNANFFSGKHAPLFILLSRPTAIDGRNPKWESPLSQIAVLCSYRAETYDDTWLLLKKRSTKICDYENAKQLNKSHSASQEVIKLAKVDIKKTASEKLMTLLFKQLNYDTVTSNGVEWNLVNANNNYLIVNVPDEIDFPSIWSYGKQNQLLAKSNQKISYLILKSE